MHRTEPLRLAVTLAFALAAPSAASSEPDDGESVHHKHHMAGFLGAAVRDEQELESGFVIGLDYHYRLFPQLSAGLLVEAATGNLREVVVLAPVILHPWRGSYFLAAPGVEVPGGGNAEFALRLGLGYGFPIGAILVGPEFAVDLIDWKPTYVFGVAFGVGF
jgi:hypothetical protein